MEKMERWKERLKSYSKALFQLESALQQKQFSVLEKDGVIKRFEFTFELAWKTLQDKLYDQGYLSTKGPKQVIKQDFNNEIITLKKIQNIKSMVFKIFIIQLMH